MNAKTATGASARATQELCIDLPGETVRCWRSADHIKVILRKHRDVFFDINIQKASTYTIESISDFYSPRDKKLLRKVQFQDGEQFNLWIGRNFKGKLTLKSENNVIGVFEPNKIDAHEYGMDPKIKPEPLLIMVGKRELSSSFVCKVTDPHGISEAPGIFKPEFDPKLLALKSFGSSFSYQITLQPPEIKEYVAIVEATPDQIQPLVLNQLNSGVAVEGKVKDIFMLPTESELGADIYTAMRNAAIQISGNSFLNSNMFKESAGYLQENWRQLNKVAMTVRIEKRVTGKYRVIFKGKPLTKIAAHLIGAAGSARVVHERVQMGSEKAAFLDGGYTRTGRNGYGGTKRILLTAAENFHAGLKIQVVGTIIDIIGDANAVYFDEKGSKDLSEFIGRAGVTVVEAGASAVIGSVLVAIFTAIFAAVSGAVAVPVIAGMMIAVAGYVVAATIVGVIDKEFDIKANIAGWAK